MGLLSGSPRSFMPVLGSGSLLSHTQGLLVVRESCGVRQSTHGCPTQTPAWHDVGVSGANTNYSQQSWSGVRRGCLKLESLDDLPDFWQKAGHVLHGFKDAGVAASATATRDSARATSSLQQGAAPCRANPCISAGAVQGAKLEAETQEHLRARWDLLQAESLGPAACFMSQCSSLVLGTCGT